MFRKPPLIKWACKHKLWEKLETAAFSPRLLQIGWPPGPIWKESLLKWLPKGHSPQISQGGGRCKWAYGLIVGHSFWKLFFDLGIFLNIDLKVVLCLTWRNFCQFWDQFLTDRIFWATFPKHSQNKCFYHVLILSTTVYCLVYDRNHLFGLGLIPKPKLKIWP